MTALLALMLLAGQSGDFQPNCSDPQTQMDMNICSQRAAAAADARLNALWPRVRTLMVANDADFASLRSADKRPGYWAMALAGQRAWLNWRESQCTLEGYAARGGTMEAMLVAQCRERLTLERNAQLEELLGAG